MKEKGVFAVNVNGPDVVVEGNACGPVEVGAVG